MTYEDLKRNVIAGLPRWEAVSASEIQKRYRVLMMQAHKIIGELQSEGYIGKNWDPQKRGYPVYLPPWTPARPTR